MAAWLANYRQTGNSTLAARAAGVSRDVPYDFRARNPEHPFVAEWERAAEEAIDLLEAEALRRGKEGVAEPVWYQGREVGEVQRYSDTLLIFLLKALRPEKYRDNYHVAVEGRMQVDVTHREISELDRRIERLLGRMADLDAGGQGPPGLAAGGEAEPADPAR